MKVLDTKFLHTYAFLFFRFKPEDEWENVPTEDLMPDNYLRDTQRLSLRLQEKCMAHLREGG